MKRAAVVATAFLLSACPSPRAAVDEWQRSKECAAQAEHEFIAEGHSRGQRTNLKSFASFTSHYNPHLAKCFLLIETAESDFGVWTGKNLSDAFEGKIYGNYSFKADPVKTYREVAPIECFALSALGQKQQCKSGDEFDEMVKAYMETSNK